MRWKEGASKFRGEERYGMPPNSGHRICCGRCKIFGQRPCVSARRKATTAFRSPGTRAHRKRWSAGQAGRAHPE